MISQFLIWISKTNSKKDLYNRHSKKCYSFKFDATTQLIFHGFRHWYNHSLILFKKISVLGPEVVYKSCWDPATTLTRAGFLLGSSRHLLQLLRRISSFPLNSWHMAGLLGKRSKISWRLELGPLSFNGTLWFAL